MGDPIYFNPTDPSVLRFLQELGFDNGEIKNGEIDETIARKREVNFGVLQYIATRNFPPNDIIQTPPTCDSTGGCVTYEFGGVLLAEEEVNRYYFLHPEQDRLALLLKTNRCPGNGSEALTIASNLLGNGFRIGKYITPPTCRFLDHLQFPLEALRRIHYRSTQLPPHIAQLGMPVYLVQGTDQSQGSAVLVSSSGDLYSSWHVFYDKNNGGKYRNPSVTIDGKEVAIREEQIYFKDPAQDLIKIKIPELLGKTHSTQTDQPPLMGDVVWIIGYQKDHKSFTLGRIRSYDPQNNLIETDADGWFGYSGGAVIRASDRRLLGITREMQVNQWVESDGGAVVYSVDDHGQPQDVLLGQLRVHVSKNIATSVY